MRNLGWHTPTECTTDNTPYLSPFMFFIWKKVYYLDLGAKQLESKHEPARFLGIAWDHGDNLCHCVQTILTKKMLAILIRSIVRILKKIDVLEGAYDLNPLRFNENKKCEYTTCAW